MTTDKHCAAVLPLRGGDRPCGQLRGLHLIKGTGGHWACTTAGHAAKVIRMYRSALDLDDTTPQLLQYQAEGR